MNFVTEEFVTQLGLPIQRQSMEVTGLNTSKTIISGVVRMHIASRINQYKKEIICAVVGNITTHMPQCCIDAARFTVPEAMVLADEQFWRPGPVQLLLGTEVFNLGCAQFLGPALPTLT